MILDELVVKPSPAIVENLTEKSEPELAWASSTTRSFEFLGLVLLTLNGVASIYAVVAVALWIFNGSDWFRETILPIHALGFVCLVLLTFFVLIPLMVIKWTRPYAALTVYSLSWMMGGITWFYTAHYTLVVLGTFWLVVGLFFGIVGVAPVSWIGSVIVGDWVNFAFFTFLLIMTFGCRALAFYAGKQSS